MATFCANQSGCNFGFKICMVAYWHKDHLVSTEQDKRIYFWSMLASSTFIVTNSLCRNVFCSLLLEVLRFTDLTETFNRESIFVEVWYSLNYTPRSASGIQINHVFKNDKQNNKSFFPLKRVLFSNAKSEINGFISVKRMIYRSPIRGYVLTTFQ